MPVPILVWIYVVLPFTQTHIKTVISLLSLNICRIAFCSNFTTAPRRIRSVWMYVVLLFSQTVWTIPVCAIVWIYVVLPFGQTSSPDSSQPAGLNICRITFWSNSICWSRCSFRFEYMSYYLLVKLDFARFRVDNVWIYVILPFGQTRTIFWLTLFCLNICRITFWSNSPIWPDGMVRVWIYVVLPFGQTPSSEKTSRQSLNICRITFWSNSDDQGKVRNVFEYMSYYLLVKLPTPPQFSKSVWIYVVLPFGQTFMKPSSW